MASTTDNLKLAKINGGDYVDPDVFNENFEAIDKLGLAYISEIGTSDGWQYIKFTNGFAVCAATQEGTTVAGTYEYNVKKNYPFAFAESPHLIASGGISGNVYSGIKHVGASLTLCDAWINTDNGDGGRTWWIHMLAFGTLKSAS